LIGKDRASFKDLTQGLMGVFDALVSIDEGELLRMVVKVQAGETGEIKAGARLTNPVPVSAWATAFASADQASSLEVLPLQTSRLL
jgi:hypothetical protein